ncbi:suppressor of fused domain protein [Agrobacterium larrymoorei]|uniref:Suppressor of fused domain protein n=1 Tax=Agrobacterium larrymoorei TaxID=160699 RepID=A0AAF0H9S2_9HYPH|nr:suppressor of fused domain protein [Agrobacterium larrymoorei]WHA41647.1 suppressor of fused domain protein [Agrobacterium larrymoorei]
MNLPQISEEEKLIAKYLEKSFGHRPKFFIHRDDPEDSAYVAIGQVGDFPSDKLTALATNGISNYPLYNSEGQEYPDTRLELVGACEADQVNDFEQMIFFSARTIIKQKWFCAPGTFLSNAVSRFGTFGEMQHLYFTTPFAFEGFTTSNFGDRKVSWLSPIPVSTAEVQFARENSTDKLEEAFEENDVDWFNLRRASIF